MKYVPGEGCTCAAYNSDECCCDADWTDPLVYKLESDIIDLEKALKRLRRQYLQLDREYEESMEDFEERFYHPPKLKYVSRALQETT